MSTTVSATTDRISLIGLSARGHHGVLPFEREEGQLFTVDVILDLGQRGTAVAAVTDSVTDAVDYSRVANGIVSIIEGEPVNLIESLADRIAERVLSFPRVVAAEVTVHKPEAPLDVAFEDVSVTIHRVADAAAGHGGSPATSQAAWAAQGEEPVAVSAQSFGTPSSSASPVAAASPAVPAYEPPAATPAAPLLSEVSDVTGASFAADAAAAAAAPTVPTSEPPITPTPSPASPLEAPARSSFAAAVPSVPTPIPAEPSASSGAGAPTRSWAPDWSTGSSASSASSSWAPEVPEVAGTSEPLESSGGSHSAAADASSAAGLLDTPSTSAPTAASAGRTAGADGFVSLAADALGVAPAASEPEPVASSHTEEVAADASAGVPTQPDSAADELAVQLPREGRHVASSEEVEQQAAPVVDTPADLLGGSRPLGEPGSYDGASYNETGYSGASYSESAGTLGADSDGSSSASSASAALNGFGSDSGAAAADGFASVSAASASQPLSEPEPTPFTAPGEYPGAMGQEAQGSAAPSYSEGFSQLGDASYAAPETSAPTQPGFPGIPAPGTAPAAAAPAAPEVPAAPTDPLAERPARAVGVVFSLGANVGGVVESLRTAVQSLKTAEGIEVTQVAPLARTVAVVAEGAEPQPDYLNTVVMAMTTLSPRELLEVCHSLEAAAGRVRTEPWGVRTLDVDLIEVEGVTSADPALSLPHPRAVERAFVLVPWSQADPFAELAGRSVSELAENAPDRGGLRWLAFDWLDSDSLPDKPTGPYVEPPVEQEAADAEPQRVYDATRDESSVANAANASLAADYANSVSGSSPASSAQPLGSQAPVEPAPFDQAPFESSYDAGAWSGQAPQIDSPYQASSAPEASGAAGPQDAYAPGQVDGAGGFPSNQQDVGSYANYAGQQGQVAPAAQPQDDAAGDAWQSPLQWNDVIGGGSQGTGPRQDV